MGGCLSTQYEKLSSHLRKGILISLSLSFFLTFFFFFLQILEFSLFHIFTLSLFLFYTFLLFSPLPVSPSPSSFSALFLSAASPFSFCNFVCSLFFSLLISPLDSSLCPFSPILIYYTFLLLTHSFLSPSLFSVTVRFFIHLSIYLSIFSFFFFFSSSLSFVFLNLNCRHQKSTFLMLLIFKIILSVCTFFFSFLLRRPNSNVFLSLILHKEFFLRFLSPFLKHLLPLFIQFLLICQTLPRQSYTCYTLTHFKKSFLFHY
ncbi:unnamed protein product [Acanthosepion pharaonis]|uniref:Uncharacterized protein n=1 Tax=Acanthosepion pharaonis TaxID=158019 RepID=A0A812E168_ACAPH|nr:unnamed protein product [Sepia pharaonis]